MSDQAVVSQSFVSKQCTKIQWNKVSGQDKFLVKVNGQKVENTCVVLTKGYSLNCAFTNWYS